MKRILLSWSLLAIACINQTANAQCTVSNATIEVNNITPNGGNSCTINFDLSWTQEINGGNKFAYVHLWRNTAYHTPAAAWPAGGTAIYTGPTRYPETAQLVNSLVTIVIENNNTATPSIGTSYYPDPSIVEFTSATITKTALNGTQERMTIGNISLSFTDCNTSIALQGDIWASQASNGKNVHCASQGLSVVLNDPRVIGLKKCTTPRVFNVSISTVSTTNVNVYYKLYKDDGDGIFEPGADALLTTSSTFDISASSPYVQENVPYPGNNIPGENSALWVEVLKTSGGTFSTVAYLASAACSPLPVDMKMFTADRNRSSVVLKWETMTEQNNAGFGIERNAGGAWQQIAFVPTQAQGGNSNSILAYQYTDINTVKGITQYRIRQVDQDGRVKYSAIRSVRGENQSSSTIVYPNPSNDGTVNIVFSTVNVKRNVTIVDMSGRVVKQWKDVTSNNLQVTNLSTGIFTAKIVDVETGEQTVEKLIVNKR